MAKHETQWILELIDRISGPAKKVMASVSSVTGRAKEMTSHFTSLAAKGDRIFGGIATGFSKIKDSARSIPVLGTAIELLENPITAVLSGVVALGLTLGVMTSKAGDYKQELAELSAITGTVGTDLDFLGDKGLEMAARFGISSGKAVEAFKLLASNIDITTIGGVQGLAMLQEQTITLAKAAGVDMPLAADTMAAAINQFGLDASEASRVVNVLAAGAKYGAAEIPDLALSLKVAGTTASLAGVSIEETTAALELLSQSALKGSEAGTGFRNVLLALQTKEIAGVDFATMGLTGSLEALRPHLQDTTMLAKAFGRENISAAQILIKNAGAMQEMTDKVTGTNVAMEQAAIQTNTWRGSLDVLGSLWEVISIKIGSVLIDILKPALDGLNSAMQWIIDNGTAIKAVFIGLGVSLTGMGVAWLFANGAALAASVGLGIFNLAFAAFNALLAISPIGWVIIAVGALAAGVYYAWNEFESFRGTVVGVWEAVKVFGQFLYEAVIVRLKDMLSGITGIGGALKAFFSGDFSEAWEIGKKAIGDLSGMNSAKEISAMYKQAGADSAVAFVDGYGKGVGMADPTTDPAEGGTAQSSFNPAGMNLDGKNPGGAITSKSKSGIEGGGGNKIVTMTIGDIVMNFNLPKEMRSGAEEVANEFATKVTSQLRNGIALGS